MSNQRIPEKLIQQNIEMLTDAHANLAQLLAEKICENESGYVTITMQLTRRKLTAVNLDWYPQGDTEPPPPQPNRD